MIIKSILTALAAAGLSTAAFAAPAWITIGDDALAVLQRAAPYAVKLASQQVAVTVPVRRGSAALKLASEGVHAVEIDDGMLPTLSLAVHRELQRCGGYVQHQSMAEALATLHQLSKPAPALLAPSYAIDDVAEVNAMLPQMQASNILSTIAQLSNFQNRRFNSPYGAAASDWLYNQWQQLNPGTRKNIQVRQIAHPGWIQKSVEFTFVGTGNSGETVVLGAHLDSINGGSMDARAPGADDDASGVASLTEIIRVLVANNYRPARNLRFIAYSAEEVGLLGSSAIAENQLVGRRDKVVGVLQLDMTAYQGSATDIWFFTDYTNTLQNQFLANLVSSYQPQLTVGYDRCGYGCSDHVSWHTRGFIVSFPFESSDTTYNPRIHTPDDTIANFGGQADHALKFAKLGMSFALELGGDTQQATLQQPPPLAVQVKQSQR